MTEQGDLKWEFFFDINKEGKVVFRATDLDTGLPVTTMILTPNDADNIGEALQQQAERARRKLRTREA